jgi:hypothetical protein
MASGPPRSQPPSEDATRSESRVATIPRDPKRLWQNVGIAAYFTAFIVALLTFMGADIIANAIAPRDGGAITFGAIALGVAAGAAVLAVILTLRKAVLPEPPPAPPTPPNPGKVEV